MNLDRNKRGETLSLNSDFSSLYLKIIGKTLTLPGKL